MLEVRILNANEVRTYVDQVRRIHDVCFPDDVDDVSGSDDEGGLSNFETKDDRFWDRLAACHDTEHVLWFLLVERGEANTSGTHVASTSSGAHPEGVPKKAKPATNVILGFAAATRYATCAYGMHLAVDPKHRGKGHGAWLMREVQSWAVTHGYTQMQASVDAGTKKLLRYYEKLGAYVVVGNSQSGGSSATAETVTRIARDFDALLCEKELRMSRELGAVGGTSGNKSAARVTKAFALVLGVAFGVFRSRR
jgi:GNAT superfamily N-acetyltransferase|tara:strand:+ start:1666 stop:2421 length:756 start_codon:yes stop_codon:yes gene_type:complete|mmetsp:Transcript_11636/g.43114  ORF Transcript_11636/g.43114 Transcript_11636/m.43114 type:complete len:252 (-) Transcript_11636:2596-3351(-)